MKRAAKKTLALLSSAALAGSMTASGAIIAGWDTWVDQGGDTYNATVLTGTTATAVGTADTVGGTYPGWANWGGSAAHNWGASIDGTWGTIADSAPSTGVADATEAVGLLNRTPSGEMTFTITNTSGNDIILSGFHFDGFRARTSAPDAWELSILGGSSITVGSVDTGTVVTDNSSPFLDRGDYDIDLTALADRTLANGESAIFELAFTGGSGVPAGGNNTMIDNVAITGVPEPVSIMLGALGLSFLGIRRRRR